MSILRDETTTRTHGTPGRHIYVSPNVVDDVDYHQFVSQELEKIVAWDTQAMELDKLRYVLKILQVSRALFI
jgi:hypothetical protein